MISEKAVNLSGKGQYVFLVENAANKSEVKKAIEEMYKVTVTGVSSARIKNKRRNLKKIIVTLKPGDKINIES